MVGWLACLLVCLLGLGSSLSGAMGLWGFVCPPFSKDGMALPGNFTHYNSVILLHHAL